MVSLSKTGWGSFARVVALELLLKSGCDVDIDIAQDVIDASPMTPPGMLNQGLFRGGIGGL